MMMDLSRVTGLFVSKERSKRHSLDQISFLAKLRRVQGRFYRSSDDRAITNAEPTSYQDGLRRSNSEPPKLSLSPILPTVFPVLPDGQLIEPVLERHNHSSHGQQLKNNQTDLVARHIRHNSNVESGVLSSEHPEDQQRQKPLPIIEHSPTIVPLRHPPLCAPSPERSILRSSNPDPNIQKRHDRTSPRDTANNTSRNLLLTLNDSLDCENIHLLRPSERARRFAQPPIPPESPPEAEPRTDHFRNKSVPTGPGPSIYSSTNQSTVTVSSSGGRKQPSPPKKTVRFDRIDVHTYTEPGVDSPSETKRTGRPDETNKVSSVQEQEESGCGIVETNCFFAPGDIEAWFDKATTI